VGILGRQLAGRVISYGGGITHSKRVRKFVMGGSHIGTGRDRYLMANRPSEGSRATRQALDDPSRENIRRFQVPEATESF